MISDMFFYVLGWPSRYDFVLRHANELHLSEQIFAAPTGGADRVFDFAVAFAIGMFAFKAIMAIIATEPYFPPIS